MSSAEESTPHEDAGAIDLTFTTFPNTQAATCQRRTMTLAELVELIKRTTAGHKSQLPWIKLAIFGDQRSENNSLRNNDNVRGATGAEGDYDREITSFTTAVEMVRQAGVLAVLYTSPSHTADEPRWRVLCPFSRTLPPGDRIQMVDRLNGVLGGRTRPGVLDVIAVVLLRRRWRTARSGAS